MYAASVEARAAAAVVVAAAAAEAASEAAAAGWAGRLAAAEAKVEACAREREEAGAVAEAKVCKVNGRVELFNMLICARSMNVRRGGWGCPYLYFLVSGAL
jgi:hypothetical protein